MVYVCSVVLVSCSHCQSSLPFGFPAQFAYIFISLVQLVTSPTADLGVFYLSWEIDHEIICKVFLLLPLIQEGLLSVTSESMCTVLVNRLLKLVQEKVWLGELTIST